MPEQQFRSVQSVPGLLTCLHNGHRTIGIFTPPPRPPLPPSRGHASLLHIFNRLRYASTALSSLGRVTKLLGSIFLLENREDFYC